MKDDKAFREYLTEKYRSEKTGMPYPDKVAGDIISRCKRIEKVLGIDLSKNFALKNRDLGALAEKIKSKRSQFGSTAGRPYGYLNYLHALKAYYIFCGFKPKRTTTHKEHGAFREYLNNYLSEYTGKPYSKLTVIGTISRCRRIEKVLGIDLSKDFVLKNRDLGALAEKIKSKRSQFGSTATRPNAYLSYVKALQDYYSFVGVKPKG